MWTKQAREITKVFEGLREKHAADVAKIREAFEAVHATWQPLFAELERFPINLHRIRRRRSSFRIPGA
ncbi:hypothetical protein P1J78_25105 [Psychromarinibacter sp. C21-152]|uniref:Uncharacterized protein n=1 Tax=Psychromarinibacter sediminicola TaxID=3033385 RepID=A0AAE3NYH6_9RHOB|nr:hypothetical protein [Psychromarinibacter sediminicola]MDF0603989.1 hypothetical protein [Psychromarinibacter sediminicola]